MNTHVAAAPAQAQQATSEGLWLHFSQLAAYRHQPPRTIVRGQGVHVWDRDGHRYFDGLASLYCVNVGHGRREIAEAVRDQLEELDYFPLWNYATPRALELASRIADLAPDGLGWTFFTSGGSESVETAWKLARQYHAVQGSPEKTKIISRAGSYHGTTLGALSITGALSIREPFEPLVPGAIHAPKVDAFHAETDAVTHAEECARAVEEIVEAEGPETVGAVIVEPVQNSGGCLVAEPNYFQRLREICDRHDLLFISDETICSWGRLGSIFGSEKLGYRPDIITTAKAMTSAYIPMGAVVASDKVVEPFLAPGRSFAHGLTFGGHPAGAAAALMNIEILESERLCERAEELGAHFRAELESLYELPLVGDVRGVAMFQAIELVADRDEKRAFNQAQTQFLTEFVPPALLDRGLICRAMHRGAPVLQFAPPLVSSKEDLSLAVEVVADVLRSAESNLPRD